MDGVFKSFFILFLFADALYFGRRVTAEGGNSKNIADGVILTSDSTKGLSIGESSQSNFTNNIEKSNISLDLTIPNLQNANKSDISVISDVNVSVTNISVGNISYLLSAPNNKSGISGINVTVTTTVAPLVGIDNINKSIEIIKNADETGVRYKSFVVTESVFKVNNSKSSESYVNLNDSVSNNNKANGSLIVDVQVNENNDESKSRGDMDPFDTLEQEDSRPLTAENTHQNYSAFTDIVSVERSHIYSTMSWLDVFMLEHRGTLWIVFNTLFMIIWIFLGGLSLYRLLGLPYCSPYISRTKYLVIHLLIFTASTFEFVQLIHFSYGSHEGLPLFLTLLLTHTPTPCLAGALILAVYCVFVAARVPMFFNYLPPIIYVSILISFIIVLSFVGDIIVGVTRNGIFLIVCRVALLVLCLIVLLSFIFNYRRIVSVASIMRREFRGEMKALSLPGESVEENQEVKLHLKKILLTWTRITLLSCLSGIFMCLFSFCLSLFFTVSFVPLWAFWVLHTAIFVTQVLVVFSITFGAAYTLSYSSRESIFRKYFLPSFVSANSTNRSFIKRGNFIYQRVSVANGPTITPSPVPTTIMETDDQNFLPNNNLVTEMAPSPFRSKVNLKRSATFNCSPYYGFHRPSCSPFTPNLYPVLSDHILPHSQSQLYSSYNRHDVNAYKGAYHKSSLQHSNSFSHNIPNRGNDIVNYGNKYPLKSFHAKDRFVDLDIISKGGPITEDSNRSCSENSPVCITSNPLGMAGTVEPLEVAYAPINIISIRNSPDQNLIRQIPLNHSFNVADRHRYKHGPPEKPARRAEPILVKGVMKDNSYVKSTVPVSDMYSPDKTNNPYSIKDFNGSRNNISRDKSLMYNITLGTGLSPSLESTNTSTPIPISKTSFATSSPSVSPIGSQYKPSTYDTNVVPNTNTIYPSTYFPKESTYNRGNISFTQETTPRTNGVCTTVLKYPEESLQEIHPLIDKPEINDGNISLSTDDTHNSLESSPVPKRHSLRRNHSTAGDFPAREKIIDTEEESISGDYHQVINGYKHPWYGTWGGRRKSKRKCSTNGQDTTSTSTLRRLSASKSSLSSIYEKIKPKRNKGSHKHFQADEAQELSSETNENSSISHEEEVEEEEEEEEEFLPRLDEDIDLASDIFKSSTVLADFYSLDRSYLKKRKKAQLAEREEEEMAIEMNGINSEVGNNHDNRVNDNET